MKENNTQPFTKGKLLVDGISPDAMLPIFLRYIENLDKAAQETGDINLSYHLIVQKAKQLLNQLK